MYGSHEINKSVRRCAYNTVHVRVHQTIHIECRVEVEGGGRLLLPGGAWARVVSGGPNSLTAQLGWVAPDGTLKTATRSFSGGELESTSFVHAKSSPQ